MGKVEFGCHSESEFSHTPFIAFINSDGERFEMIADRTYSSEQAAKEFCMFAHLVLTSEEHKRNVQFHPRGDG